MASEKEHVALGSILASGGLTAAKGIVGFATGSLAILTDAAHSLIDLLATVMTYFAVRIGGKPADEEHHYGHGKIESISALAETALLFVLSAIVMRCCSGLAASRSVITGRIRSPPSRLRS
jgi:cation diffusion facilitator family transporter